MTTTVTTTAAEVGQAAGACWLTPGVQFASRLATHPLVRFIGEKVQPGYLQTVIIVDDNPESLLNEIFTIEQSLYAELKGFRFEVRVLTTPSAESIETIKNTYFPCYDRVFSYNEDTITMRGYPKGFVPR